MIYIASSWKNKYFNNVINELKRHKIDFYNFKNPNINDYGFHWSFIDKNWQKWNFKNYIKEYIKDKKAMSLCNMCILVLPCGKSSHLELGYFIGKKCKTYIYMPEKQKPELMYKFVNFISNNIHDIIDIIKKQS